MILCGDSLEILPTLDAESVDAVVTDPPYGLGFMGRQWDHGVPGVPFWTEALRVAKPGAHLVAFGGTRTHHRLACAIEDAGWEIRDCLQWIYGSGFPKSLDVSKAIDRAAGAERVAWEVPRNGGPGGKSDHIGQISGDRKSGVSLASAPATEAAKQWDGWGTALKPSYEIIILARKPLRGTVAANVERYGTGAINVDGCRVGTSKRVPGGSPRRAPQGPAYGDLGNDPGDGGGWDANLGRWPANTILGCACEHEHDPGCAVAVLDGQSGESGDNHRANKGRTHGSVYGAGRGLEGLPGGPRGPSDYGGASRFFKVVKWTQDDVSAAEKISSQQNKHGGSAPSDAQTDPEPTAEETPSRSTSATPTESKPKHGSGTQRIQTSAQGVSPEPQPERQTGANAHAKGAGPAKQTATTTTTTSQPRSGGFVDPATLPITATSAEHGEAGSASRMYYTAKASRSEREAGLEHQSFIWVRWQWENEDRKARLRVVMGTSRPRVISVSGTPDSNATEWNTLLFGSESAAPFLTACKSTIETGTNSTTRSEIWRWLVRSFTSGSTEDASSAMGNGSSRAASAEPSSLSVTITSDETGSLPGVGRVASGTRLTISASEKAVMHDGRSKPIDNPYLRGETQRRADHPTIKPLSLMRWLVRLVTPPGGTVLDPFMGSGTTGCACVYEGFDFYGIDLEAEHVEIAEGRILAAKEAAGKLTAEDVANAPEVGTKQLGLF